jgi:small multidrug resistance pump
MGLTRPWSSLAAMVGHTASFSILAFALRFVPVGLASAIWSGAGIVHVMALAWTLNLRPGRC